jgi:PKD repeat protein
MNKYKYILHFFIIIACNLFHPFETLAQTPDLVFPKDNYNFSKKDSVFFSWNIIAGAAYYELEIAGDQAFSINDIIYKVYNLEADTTLRNLSFCNTYFWRVRAFSPVATNYSAVSSFSVFNPKCLSGLDLWLDADSGVVANGANKISVWKDRSGKGKNATQTNSSQQALLFKETSVTSNKSSFVKLDGADDFFDIDSSARVGSFFSVFDWHGSLPNFSGYNTLFAAKGTTPKGFILLGLPGQTNYYVDGTYNGFTPAELEINTVNTLNMAPLDRLKMVEGITSPSTNFSNFFIGKLQGDATSFWNGNIGDILIYNLALTGIQKGQVEKYLMDKYAPPVNLDKDKIVCSLPYTIQAKKNYFVNYVWQDASTADSLVINSPGTYYVTATNVFGKTSSDTIKIGLDPGSFTVDLGSDTSICSGEVLLLIAGPPHLNYTWSTGATSRYIRINSSGGYWVSVTDCNGNITTDTINITVNSLPSFNLGNDTLICYNSGFVLDPGFVNSTSLIFNWFDNTNDSIHNIDHSGNYWLNVTNSFGCKFNDSVNIIVDSLLFSTSLGNDTSLCSGNSIYLKNGAAQATSYLWSDSSINDSLQINSSGQYWVTVSDINSCSKKDTINISIAGNAPVALFSSNNTCLGNSIQFNDLSTPPSGDIISLWKWDFGDNTTSTLQNPSHMFADTGSYVVKLIVTTNAGCSSAYSRIIHVYPNPVVSFTSSNLCQNANVQFTGNASTFGYPVNQWSWYFNDPASGINDSSLLQNPKHVFSLNGTYSVRLIVSNINGCADTAVNNVIIKPAPVTDFSSSLSCKSDLTQFTDNTVLPSATSIQSSFWNFGDLVTSTLLNPKHIYSANVSYSVTHVITATNGCKDTTIKTITVYPKPFAYFTYGNTCVGTPTYFNDLSVISGATITGWQWSFGTGTSSLQNPQHTFATSGNINTQLIVISDQGCKDTTIQSVTIHSNPVASFTFNPAYGTPPLTAFFNNTSTGASSYSWNFDDGSALSTLISPSHIFNDTGSFQVSLAAINAFGCTDTIVHSINTALRITDAGIAGFTTSFQNNFLTVTAQIDNHGTVDIHTMELYAKVNDGPFIKEEWGGSLLKDGTMFYTFNSDLFVANEDHYVCVSIQKPNGLNDDRPADNEFCQTLTIAGFQTFSPYPNPTENMIALPVFMPVSNDLSIVLYNSQGKKIEDVYSGSLEEGFHTIQFNTEGLNAGLYVFKIKYKDETVVRKFIKK